MIYQLSHHLSFSANPLCPRTLTKSCFGLSVKVLSCRMAWHLISHSVWQNELNVPDTCIIPGCKGLSSSHSPCLHCSYFLMTKCLFETIEVDFCPNPGYSVGSLCCSGSQRFRQLTKHDCFTSAPLAACNAFHTGKERWAREWDGMDSYSNACWAGLGGEEGHATPATITHHLAALNLETAKWT